MNEEKKQTKNNPNQLKLKHTYLKMQKNKM